MTEQLNWTELGTMRDTHPFPLVPHSYLFIRLRLLTEVSYKKTFFPKETEKILKFNSSHQYNQPGDHLSLSNQLPSSLWEKFLTDIGKIHSIPPFKTQIDPSKPLSKIIQYSVSKEVFQGIKSIIEDYKAQSLIISYTSPVTFPFYQWENVRDKGGGFSRTSEQ